jgi:hypothetical protein
MKKSKFNEEQAARHDVLGRRSRGVPEQAVGCRRRQAGCSSYEPDTALVREAYPLPRHVGQK